MKNKCAPAIRVPFPTTFYSFLFISCCLFASSLQAQSQWQWLNPRPSGITNRKVVFADSATGYILNENGDLYRTTDAGSHWQAVQTFGNALCMDVKDSTGVVAGYYTAYLSTDNGASWTGLNIAGAGQINNVDIISRDTIVLTTPYNTLYKTVDRGTTWTTLQCHAYISAVSFANSSVGYIGGQGSAIHKTADGGNTWTEKYNTGGYGISSMEFLDQDTGYAYQSSNALLKTTDGGDTWTSTYTSDNVGAMDFINTTDGYFGGENGAMLATHDGGQTFEWIGFDGRRDGNLINSVRFLSRDTGYAVGLLGRIIKTTDAGQSWVSYSPDYLPITAVSFGSATTGIATSWNYLYKTTDRGQTWDTLKTLTTGLQYADYSRFAQAYFSSADTGLVAASLSNKVYTTTNGGNTWDSVKVLSGSDYYPSDMQFLTKTTGFITFTSTSGPYAAIAETKDGGHSWTTVWDANFTYQSFYHIYYVNEDTGYAASHYTLYKTTDGSKTWTAVYQSADFYEITGVSFSSVNKGLITTEEGKIISTTDGGTTWTTATLPNYYSWGIQALKFYNAQTGYLIAKSYLYGPINSGDVYKTTDSGATWTLDNHIGGTSISFTPDTSVMIAGYGGAITTSRITGLVVLPVQIVSIRASYTPKGNLVTWKTANETNSSRFVIESSTDGSHFHSIGTQAVTGSSTTQATYSFTDTSSVYSDAKRMYYRIRMVDMNGASRYTGIAAADMPARLLHLVISPNPASDQTVIYLDKPAGKTVFSVFDAQGKRVLSGQFPAGSRQYRLATTQLQAGTYVLNAEGESGTYSGRFVVIK